MTEIPEHLLKRSRERRAALGLGGGEEPAAAAPAEGEGAPAAATPATTTPAAAPAAPAGPAGRKPAPAPVEEPPPKPDPPYVAAAKARPKIPFWAMAALSLMPIWVFMYVRAITEPAEVVAGPMGVGADAYGSCSSCHGAGGEGGTGYQLNDGEVHLTFAHIEDHIRFVYWGTQAYNVAGISVYGNPDRAGGAHTTGQQGVMPQWGALAGGDLTDEEILGVVCHERFGLSGSPDPATDEAAAEEFELWCAEESPIFVAVEGGTPLTELADAGLTDAEGNPVEIIPIGDAPAEGNAP